MTMDLFGQPSSRTPCLQWLEFCLSKNYPSVLYHTAHVVNSSPGHTERDKSQGSSHRQQKPTGFPSLLCGGHFSRAPSHNSSFFTESSSPSRSSKCEDIIAVTFKTFKTSQRTRDHARLIPCGHEVV